MSIGKLNKGLKAKVIEAAEYVENGDPWKDVMNDSEVSEVLIYLAQVLRGRYVYV